MKVVFLDTATFSGNVDLREPHGVTEYKSFETTEQDADIIVQRCQEADIIITNKVEFTRSTLIRLPNLKLLQLTATGMNNVDQDACEDLGIALSNVAGYAIKSVPEHTFMLMLTSMRACLHYHQTVATEAWQKTGKFCVLDESIFDLEGKTLGIIGAGTIGRRVAEIARVFGMTVLFAERKGCLPRSDEYMMFEQVLAEADVLSLHCPLTEQTKHLINNATIALMTRKPLIINVARGGVVDSQAIANALNKGDVFGYGSDVFESEPLNSDDPLRAFIDHPRVVFTPHNAWGSLSAQQELWDIARQKVTDFINTANL